MEPAKTIEQPETRRQQEPFVPLPSPFYDRDGITIYCGDCRQVLPFLDRFDLLLTDPSYGIGFAAQPTKWQRLAGETPKEWDDKPPASWIVRQMVELADTNIIWGGNYYGLEPSRCWLSWFKPDSPPSMANVEYAWTNMDRNSRQMSWSISATNAERVAHPTQKPLAVMKWCLSFAADAKTVLDPFAGSGTTLVAAKQLGLRAVGIEVNREYCELAVQRLRQDVFDFGEN